MNRSNTLLSFQETCQKLLISKATCRNWIRLKRLTPVFGKGCKAQFDRAQVDSLLQDIRLGRKTSLRSRRNKRHISGFGFYKDYIGSQSHNICAAQEIIASGPYPEPCLPYILAGYALLLLCQAQGIPCPQNDGSVLYDFLNGTLDIGPYSALINDLLAGSDKRFASPRHLCAALSGRLNYRAYEDVLGLLYISLKNTGSRKSSGIYYTPAHIVDQMVQPLISQTGSSCPDMIDPCCGTGNFLLSLAKSPYGAARLHGQDVDPVAVTLTRINLALCPKRPDLNTLYKNITCGDTLHSLPHKEYGLIVGNPPWGSLSLHARHVDHMDSCALFLEQAIGRLSPGGTLSFVLPESLLTVRSHKKIRQLLLSRTQINRIDYLGNIFDGVQCPAVILTLQHSGKPCSAKGICIHSAGHDFLIRKERNLSAERICLRTTDREYALLQKLEHTPGCITLKGKADFALGIVTGNNQALLADQNHENTEPVLKGAELRKYRFMPPSQSIVYQPEKFQQTAPEQLYRAPEKLLYRFVGGCLVFAYDNQGTLSLNSCNIVIPRAEGFCIKYILAALNSRAMQFYFTQTFSSVKILRSHIEALPIPAANEKEQNEIALLADQLLCESNPAALRALYEDIDRRLMRLFLLAEDEQEYIRNMLQNKNDFLI